MAIGPGKYDDLCTYVREHANAEGALLLVVRGDHGTGFSTQLRASVHPHEIVKMLRAVADQIERDGNRNVA